MITIESTDKEYRVSIPRDEFDPVQLERLLRPFRLESVASHSQLSDQTAHQVAEEMKSKWWEENKSRFLPSDLV